MSNGLVVPQVHCGRIRSSVHSCIDPDLNGNTMFHHEENAKIKICIYFSMLKIFLNSYFLVFSIRDGCYSLSNIYILSKFIMFSTSREVIIFFPFRSIYMVYYGKGFSIN